MRVHPTWRQHRAVRAASQYRAPVGQRKPPAGSTAHSRRIGNRVGASAEDEQSSGRWDVFRFAKTVAFFNRVSPQDILKAILSPLSQGSAPSEEKMPFETVLGASQATRPATLVMGATSTVGQKVVAGLLSGGQRVRALVPAGANARQQLQQMPSSATAALELVTWDAALPTGIPKGALKDVSCVISCMPGVGAGTDDSLKRVTEGFWSGLQLLDEPSPAAGQGEKTRGQMMAALSKQFSAQLGTATGVPLLDMANAESVWGALDDVVMGGVSQSSLQRMKSSGPRGEDVALFTGFVSTSNNGGFASVRSRNFEPGLDLSPYEGLRLMLRGDGTRYKVILRCSTGWDTVGYTASVDTPAGEWAELDVPFSDFKPVFRAKTQPDAPPLDTANIASLQVMRSKFEYDGALNPTFSPGPFQLPIASVTSYLPRQCAPRWLLLSSTAVGQLQAAASAVDPKLVPTLKDLEAAESTVLQSGIPFVNVRAGALTDSAQNAPLKVSQESHPVGAVSVEDLSSLCLHLAGSSKAWNTTISVVAPLPVKQAGEARSSGRNWDAELQPVHASIVASTTGTATNTAVTGAMV